MTTIIDQDQTSLARRASKAAKRMVMMLVPVAVRGPETVSFGAPGIGLGSDYDLTRYTSDELIAMLNGDMALPGEEG